VRAYPSLGWYNASKFAVEALSESLSQEAAPLGIKVIIVEPSGFATNWAGASATVIPEDRQIPDYAGTVGARIPAYAAGAGKEAGDPARAASVILRAVNSDSPPLRLPVGNYAVDGALEKIEQVRADILAGEEAARSADFPDRVGPGPRERPPRPLPDLRPARGTGFARPGPGTHAEAVGIQGPRPAGAADLADSRCRACHASPRAPTRASCPATRRLPHRIAVAVGAPGRPCLLTGREGG
jgi:hypothetical protein